MIKYLGSKRVLIPTILEVVDQLPGVHEVVDLFSGTSRVGHALKSRGLMVRANDYNRYAHTLARCYVQSDADVVGAHVDEVLAEMAEVPPKAGWFTHSYCVESRYLHPDNGARLEAMREWLQLQTLPADVAAVVLVSLMEAADRVDSTTGVQMAYLKQWAARATKPLSLRRPKILSGAGEAHRLDAVDAAGQLGGDLCYVDPPYNQHSYLGNYHVWETLVAWDDPDVYGKARKRVECRERKSDFNSKRRIAAAMRQVVERSPCAWMLLSFNDEGYLSREELEEMLRVRGDVRVFERDHPRYVGARIGIYNQSGKRVGKVGRTRNRELLYLAGPDVGLLDGWSGPTGA